MINGGNGVAPNSPRGALRTFVFQLALGLLCTCTAVAQNSAAPEPVGLWKTAATACEW